jgi:hypothetical protein
MVAMESRYGIRSNIFIFKHRYTQKGIDKNYQKEIDHEFFKNAEKSGFVIGYHQNAFALSGFDMKQSVEIFKDDILFLRKLYDIMYFVPHGGVGSLVNGKMVHNVDVPIPTEFEKNLRWVFNRYGVRFTKKWSDGGLRKINNLFRVKGLDIVKQFLYKLKKGTRNFCLIHPQRWGFNIDKEQNRLLAKEKWYQEICEKYSYTDH